MSDQRGPANQLLAEITRLQERVSHLERLAAACKTTEDKLTTRLELEQAVSSMASEFLASTEVDAVIDESLGEIGELRGVSRAYVFRFREKATKMENTHEWCADGVSPQIDNLKDLPTEMFPWWMDRLESGETIHVPDVSKMPPEAKAEQAILESQDIKSVLVLPLHVGRVLAGFVGFDNVKEAAAWSEDDITILRLMSWILGNALEQAETSGALRDSEERFRTVVEDLPALVCRFLPSGVLTFVNSAYCEYFGKTSEELIGRDFFQFIPEEEQEAVRGHFLALNKERPVVTYDHQIIAPDGTTRWQQWTDRAIVDDRGVVVEYQSLGRDVTESKQAEESLKESERRFRQLASENAALLAQARSDTDTKATLLHEVNHRVKNNLSSIIGLLHAEERFAKEKERPGVRSAMSNLAGRIQGMATVHEMLSAAEWAPLSLSLLTHEIIRLALQSLPRDKRVQVDVPDSQIQISPDQANSVALVINELATNSVKHALAGREIAAISVEVATADGRLSFLYRDDGPGYPKDTLRMRNRGVGLYLVENIVQNNLRGKLKLRNDGGAVTEIVFPHVAR